MPQGLDAAATGLRAQQERLDALSNDLANSNTVGYRPERVAFHDLLYQRPTDGGADGVTVGAGVATTDLGTAPGDAALESTGRALDVAVIGDGFIQARRPDGTIALTRAGSLDVDDRGQLVTAAGDLVWPRVTLPKGASSADVTIGSEGQVLLGNRTVGKITLVTVTSPDALRPEGDNDFAVTAASGPTRTVANPRLESATLEGSGVDLATTMSTMTTVERAYQMASRAVQTEDDMMEIANGGQAMSTPAIGSDPSIPLPPDLRTAPAAQQQSWRAAASFEQVLVEQLVKPIFDQSADPSAADPDSSDPDSDSGSDSLSNPYGDQIATTMAQAIMQNGGLGLAGQLAGAIAPAGTTATISTTGGSQA